MKNHILLDGDIPAYQIAATNQVAVVDNDLGYGRYIFFADAIEDAIDEYLKDIQDRLEADKTTIFLTDSKNFRKKVYPAYKSNRMIVKQSDIPPVGLKHAKDYMTEKYAAVTFKNCEADDAIAYTATEPQKKEKRIMVSTDKDFEQVVGAWLYNPGKKDYELHKINQTDGDMFLFSQVLAGDRTDGYNGIDGVGMIGAKKMLVGSGVTWRNIVAQYKAKNYSEKYALQMARCARLLRWGEYDPVTGEVSLWKPE